MLTVQLDLPYVAEAAAIAQKGGCGFLAAEHLLTALAAGGDRTTEVFFARHGMSAEAIYRVITDVYGSSGTAAGAGAPLLAHRAILTLALALAAGRAEAAPGAAYQPRHLLKALLHEEIAEGSVIEAVIGRFGLTPAAARQDSGV